MLPFTLYRDGKIVTISSDCDLSPVIRLCSFQNQLFLLSKDFTLYRGNFQPKAESIHLEKWKINIADIELYNGELYLIENNGTVVFCNLNRLSDVCDDDDDDDNYWQEFIVETDETIVTKDTTKNKNFSKVEVKRIKCNEIGKIFVTKNNEIYGCGKCGDVLATEKPIKLKSFEHHNVLDISAGETFFLVLTNTDNSEDQFDNHELINMNGDLGNNSSETVCSDANKSNSSLKRSETIELEVEDKISLNSFCKTSICSEDSESNLKMLIETGKRIVMTKLYSFGVKNDGLLGTGDHIKRTGINVVANLCDRGVCSIASGKEHSLAKTIDGKLYLWGMNSVKQIDSSGKTIDLSAPKEVKLEDSESIDFNILEACCGDFSTLILDSGFKLLQKGESVFEKNFMLHSVIVDKDIPLILVSRNFILQNHQIFAEKYLKFLTSLQTSVRTLIVNRNQVRIFGEFAKRLMIPQMSRLCQRYLDIVNLLAVCLRSVEQFFKNNCEFWDLTFIKYTNEMIKIYELYTQAFCDVKSMNSIYEIAKIYFNSEEYKSVEVYEKYFTQPFTQIFEIIKFISELVKLHTEFNEIITEKLGQWETLLRTNRIDIEIADQTKEFWLKNSKLNYLKQVHRRVILDSSKLQLKLMNGSKFSSNSFILFSDFLLQYGTQVLNFDLIALWVKIENETSLKCITPEKTFILIAKSHEDKMIWYQELENSIKLALGKSINDKLSNFRNIKYTYGEKHQKYPGVVCKGRWKYGTMHGICSMKFPDGKIYNGNVRNGEIEGYGKMSLPTNATYEGYFKSGKFHGYGILETPDKRYEGNFRDGLFHGHGELITNSYTYIGEFMANAESGYGVQEMIESGDKYMGLFAENKRSGVGIYMSVNDEYFEGVFVDGKLAGEGIAIFENGNYYEGEMIGTGPSGKGCFYMPNCIHDKKNIDDGRSDSKVKGNVITGHITGEWDNLQIQSGSVLMNQTFPEFPITIGDFVVNNNRKWRTLFDDWEEQIFGSTVLTNVKAIWNKIASYSANIREIEKIQNGLCNESYFARNITLESNAPDILSKLSSTFDKFNLRTSSGANSKRSTLEIGKNNGRKALSHETLLNRSEDFDKKFLNSPSYLDFCILSNNDHNNSSGGSSNSRSSNYSNINNNIPFLDYIPNVSIDSLMQNDVDTMKAYLLEAFRDPHHPLYLLYQRITHCFCKSYSCWKIKPSSMLADQAVMEWESLVMRTYSIVRKMFPTLPEESCCIDGSSEMLSHISLLYPILLSEKVYSLMLVLYAKKHCEKDEIYRRKTIICDKKSDSELLELLCPDKPQDFLKIVENPSFKKAVQTFKQIEENFCPQDMLNVIENSIKLIKTAHSNSSNTSSDKNVIHFSADNIIPLTIFLIVRAGVIQIGAELALLEDLLGGSVNICGHASYCYTTVKAAYEHITSDNFMGHQKTG